MQANLIIRKSKVKDGLVLIRNCEDVYFVYCDGVMLENNLQYDKISDNFNTIESSYTRN